MDVGGAERREATVRFSIDRGSGGGGGGVHEICLAFGRFHRSGDELGKRRETRFRIEVEKSGAAAVTALASGGGAADGPCSVGGNRRVGSDRICGFSFLCTHLFWTNAAQWK